MKNERIICGFLFLCFVPLEMMSAYLAFETIGEIVSGLYFFAVAINVPLAALAWKKPLMSQRGRVVAAAAKSQVAWLILDVWPHPHSHRHSD